MFRIRVQSNTGRNFIQRECIKAGVLQNNKIDIFQIRHSQRLILGRQCYPCCFSAHQSHSKGGGDQSRWNRSRLRRDKFVIIFSGNIATRCSENNHYRCSTKQLQSNGHQVYTHNGDTYVRVINRKIDPIDEFNFIVVEISLSFSLCSLNGTRNSLEIESVGVGGLYMRAFPALLPGWRTFRGILSCWQHCSRTRRGPRRISRSWPASI